MNNSRMTMLAASRNFKEPKVKKYLTRGVATSRMYGVFTKIFHIYIYFIRFAVRYTVKTMFV